MTTEIQNRPTTTAPTGLTLRLTSSTSLDVERWATKRTALEALAALRARGLNRDRDVEAHYAETPLWRFWVIGRPDHHGGVTYLMTSSGAWVPGRLADASPCFCTGRCRGGHGAPWTRLDSPVLPATVTHDYEYSAGQVGLSDGHGNPLVSRGWDGRDVERTAWAAWAWCIACRWSTHDDREDTVRAAARYHRTHPEVVAR